MLTNQQEREALVNLMLLVRFSDKKLSLAEHETFENIVKQMAWDDVMTEESYINSVIKEVRYASQTEATVESYLQTQCAVFSDEVKEVVLKKLTSVMMVDGEHESERLLMEKIKKALGL